MRAHDALEHPNRLVQVVRVWQRVQILEAIRELVLHDQRSNDICWSVFGGW